MDHRAVNHVAAPFHASGRSRRSADRRWTPAAAAVALALLWSAVAGAQSAQIPAPPQSGPIAIVNARIHPVTAPIIERGAVVFDDGRIVAMGPAGAVAIPDGAEIINADGLQLYPGLVSAHTELGLVETTAVDVTDDRREYGTMKPEVRAAVAVNPDSDLIPVTRAAGILVAGVAPTGGTVCGRASVMRLDGWTWETMAIDPEAGLVIDWPLTEPIRARWMSRSPEEQRRRIRENLESIETFFDEADAYRAARTAGVDVAPDLRFESMIDVLDGRRPVFIRASRAGQIESAVAFAIRRGLRPVIVGGAEADDVAALLKAHDVPVIVQGTHRLPTRRHDGFDEPFVLPSKLHDAGIRFCIASADRPAHERNLPHHAATAAAYGLPREDALRAVTIWPARILGVGDRYGSLEPGKSATLILTDGPDYGAGAGDPLEITTTVLDAFIDGRRIDLGSRHTRLNEKYREKYRQLGLLPANPRDAARSKSGDGSAG